MVIRAAAAVVVVGSVIGLAQAGQEPLLQAGAYEVEVIVTLPHVERWAGTTAATICIPRADDGDAAPLPVLSGNNPLANCPATHVQRQGDTLSFDIQCEGRNAARGRAVYTLMPRAFEGRIAMVMGGKNMTMTETQKGRRVGDCDPADR